VLHYLTFQPLSALSDVGVIDVSAASSLCTSLSCFVSSFMTLKKLICCQKYLSVLVVVQTVVSLIAETIQISLHKNLKTEQHEPNYKLGVNSGAPEGLAVPGPLVTPVVLLSNDTNIM
jgi:hypothetical protein